MTSINKRVEFIYDFLENHKLPKMIISNDELNSSPINELLNKKKIMVDFNNIIKMLNGKIMYIKSGSTGHVFKGILNNNIEIAIKVVGFSKKGNYGLPSNLARPENTELCMLKLFSNLVINELTPHIVLPITTFYSNTASFICNNLRKKLVNCTKYNQFIGKCENGEFYDYCSILISEWANNGDLLDYIRLFHSNLTLAHWRNIFFQIISTLAIIQEKYPTFRHNDLKANNILLQTTSKDKKEFKYIINNNEYIIPNIGIQIKIWDFDFACIPDIINNEKVNATWTNKINVTPVQNRYYDLHYFFNTLVKKGFYPELLTSDKIDNEIKKFVLRIVPLKLLKKNKYVSSRGRILIKKELTTPAKIIMHDPFFEIYRNFKPDNK